MREHPNVATWDAREWLAGLMGCARDDLAVRSIDHYGALETQIRYERSGEAVGRLTVSGPIMPMGRAAGAGYMHVAAQIGPGTEDVHTIDVPQADEIAY